MFGMLWATSETPLKKVEATLCNRITFKWGTLTANGERGFVWSRSTNLFSHGATSLLHNAANIAFQLDSVFLLPRNMLKCLYLWFLLDFICISLAYPVKYTCFFHSRPPFFILISPQFQAFPLVWLGTSHCLFLPLIWRYSLFPWCLPALFNFDCCSLRFCSVCLDCLACFWPSPASL